MRKKGLRSNSGNGLERRDSDWNRHASSLSDDFDASDVDTLRRYERRLKEE
jgi:hypothetical protein